MKLPNPWFLLKINSVLFFTAFIGFYVTKIQTWGLSALLFGSSVLMNLLGIYLESKIKDGTTPTDKK